MTDATAGEQANYSVTAGTVQSFTYHPKSRSALIRVTGPGTPGNASWETHNRLVQGGPSSSAGSGGTPLYPDAWCRLQRSGETINIYRSNDGMNWVLIGWSSLSELPETLYLVPQQV